MMKKTEKTIKITLAIIFFILALILPIIGEYRARALDQLRQERIRIIREKNLDKPTGIPSYFPGNERKMGYGSSVFCIIIVIVCLYSLKENNDYNMTYSDSAETQKVSK